jgi:hypothetical protein
MRYFCTYFDVRYALRGLTLYRSLSRHCPAFRLWVLCMDDETHVLLSGLGLPNLTAVPLAGLEAWDPELAGVKPRRQRVEYYFTCTPSLPRFILAQHPEVELLTYLDADLFFFDSPESVFDEIGSASVAIIGHRFPPQLRAFERFGIYNVGWVSFRRDEAAAECLGWWRERCLEWCHDRCEEGRFADQKYLDDWPRRFKNVAVLRHQGANVAPWNVMAQRLDGTGDRVLVDGTPLVFFHFHGFRRLGRWLYDTNLGTYGARASATVRRRIYGPYVQDLASTATEVERRTGRRPVDAPARHAPARWRWGRRWPRIERSVRRVGVVFGVAKGLALGRLVVLPRGGTA